MPKNNSSAPAPAIDLASFEKLMTDACAVAARITADKAQSPSPYAASLRSNLDHALELFGFHKSWVVENPPAATGDQAEGTPAQTE